MDAGRRNVVDYIYSISYRNYWAAVMQYVRKVDARTGLKYDN